MSTNLELVQFLRQETTDTGTGPSTVVAQTGELGRMVKWIKDGWTDLQQDREDWLWMRRSFTVNTVASTAAYAYGDCTDTTDAAAITRFARWYRNTFKCYLQSEGVGVEYPLIWMEWDQFRRLYQYGTQNDGQPVHFSQNPAEEFVLGPVPDAVYVVSGDYHMAPQVMTADDDVPEMPARFHNLVVYEAMARYGGSRIAPEVMVRAVSEGGKLRDALELTQLPKMSFGRSLA